MGIVSLLNEVYIYDNLVGLVSPITKPVEHDQAGSGNVRILWGAGFSQRFHGERFFDDDCTEDQRDSLLATMDMLVELGGHLSNTKVYRYPLKGCGNIGEFKTHQKRLFFFKNGSDLIITHGATKKRNETDKEEIARAQRIRDEILKRFASL